MTRSSDRRAPRAAHPRTTNRRGSALFLVLIISIACASLATAGVILMSGGVLVYKYHAKERDLRYAADAALQSGISLLNYYPFVIPASGYVQVATNATVATADGSTVPNVEYDLYVGPTGSATKTTGRFITLVAVAKDTSSKRQFIRWMQLNQPTFAQYAYFSVSEDGPNGSGTTTPICFGVGDRVSGPLYTDDTLFVCGGSTGPPADFMDSVWTAMAAVVETGSGNVAIPAGGGPMEATGIPVDTFYKGNKQHQKVINLPDTNSLDKVIAVASTANLAFTTPNAPADSTNIVLSRIEFVSYDLNNLAGDSTESNDGFVRFYQVDTTRSFGLSKAANAALTLAQQDTMGANYLRGGTSVSIGGTYAQYDLHNCGDWHYVQDDNGNWEWEFFPFLAHTHVWLDSVLTIAKAANYGTKGAGYDTRAATELALTAAKRVGTSTFQGYSSTSATSALAAFQTFLDEPVVSASYPMQCFPGGSPYLVAAERDTLYPWGSTANPPLRGNSTTSWWYVNHPHASGIPTGSNTGLPLNYAMRGGVDTTYTDSLHSAFGHWATYPATANFGSSFSKTLHPDYPYLFPISTALNANFKGIITASGTVAMSGVANGMVTFYTPGSVGIVDELTLTNTADTMCQHQLGIVSGYNIWALDNGVNTPQQDKAGKTFVMRPGLSDLYIDGSVMALNSFGAEGVFTDAIAANQNCGGQYSGRGCLWVEGSLIQHTRFAVGGYTNEEYGYIKEYQYQACEYKNPLPYFPATGQFSIDAYYEASPVHFTVPGLYSELSP
jgi:hypothetical protein